MPLLWSKGYKWYERAHYWWNVLAWGPGGPIGPSAPISPGVPYKRVILQSHTTFISNLKIISDVLIAYCWDIIERFLYCHRDATYFNSYKTGNCLWKHSFGLLTWCVMRYLVPLIQEVLEIHSIQVNPLVPEHGHNSHTALRRWVSTPSDRLIAEQLIDAHYHLSWLPFLPCFASSPFRSRETLWAKCAMLPWSPNQSLWQHSCVKMTFYRLYELKDEVN